MVNATGVWTDEIQALSKQRGRFQVRASKGVHVVVPRDRIVSDVAMILRTEKSVMFVIPWEVTGSSEPPIPTGTSTWRTRGHQGRHRLHPGHCQRRVGDPVDARRH